jgi:hypothetical protein
VSHDSPARIIGLAHMLAFAYMNKRYMGAACPHAAPNANLCN